MQVYQEFLSRGLAHHKAGRFDQAEVIYNRVLNRMPYEEGVLMVLADVYLRQDKNGLAINLLTNILQKSPDYAEAWCNLGIGFRKENNYADAEACWKKAIEKGGESVEVCSNLAGLYADRARPDEALEWCEKALTADPDNVEAHWQKALALLTLGRWAEGWDHYEYRQKLSTWHSRELTGAPIWDFEPTRHLYIHGEQGIGDEVMFCSVIPDALALAEEVTVEVNPKVFEIVRQTWPQVHVVTEETPGSYTARIPIGSLSTRFRRSAESFPGTPYFKPDPNRVAHYREELRRLGNGPYVALTWVGGTKQTRVEERSINLGLFKPIMDAYTCVSGQYFDTNPMVEPERLEHGLPVIDEGSTGKSLADQAAFFKAVDAVVTVQQTAVHVAGSVGAKTLALISSHPHWRYGISGESIPWYDSVTLLRNKDDWSAVIGDALNRLKGYFRAHNG
jgi:Tfp pilus assembly protein PilF